jgi:S-DNA-T family DNA segregation ATPase FtsK/SpoIIIE
VYTLNALCIEMDNRYDFAEGSRLSQHQGVQREIRRAQNSIPKRGTNICRSLCSGALMNFADLIMTAGKEIEMP